MGRVSRYKKIKSFDPFYSKQQNNVGGGRKGRSIAEHLDESTVGMWGMGNIGRKPKKQSRTAERLRVQRKRKKAETEFDAAPSSSLDHDGDDFDLNDLVGSLKKEKLAPERQEIRSTATVVVSAGSSTKTGREKTVAEPLLQEEDQEEKKLNRILKLDKQIEEKTKKQNNNVLSEGGGRMEGESKRAFQRRVMKETRQIIKRERMEQQNPEKRQRKKEFLKNKKLKKKRKKQYMTAAEYGGQDGSAYDHDGDDGEAAMSQQSEVVQFGEQAERPPTFRQLPRGATKKQKKGSESAKRSMNEAEVQAEQRAMEILRQKAHSQYALIKAKRKRAGDFHL